MIITGPTFLCLVCILLYAFFNFDRLVKIEYQKHNEDWIKDGKPAGFFWRAPDSSWISSALATQKLSFQWLFKTPEWTIDDAEARDRLRKLRRLVLIFNIGIIVWFVITMIINDKNF